VDTIAGFADRLWKDLVGTGSKQDGSLPYSVTSIALGFTGVEPGEIGQQSIEGFFRPGTGTKPPSSGSDGHTFDLTGVHRGKRGCEAEDEVGSSLDLREISQIDRDNTTGFLCPRCHQRFEIELGDDGEGESERRAEALDRLRMEHGDFHFAQELSKMPDGDDSNVRGTFGLRTMEKGRKRKRDAGKEQSVEGIAKFFVRSRRPS
jgi:DNA polymerase eta